MLAATCLSSVGTALELGLFAGIPKGSCLWGGFEKNLKNTCGFARAGERQLLCFTCGVVSLRWICT